MHTSQASTSTHVTQVSKTNKVFTTYVLTQVRTLCNATRASIGATKQKPDVGSPSSHRQSSGENAGGGRGGKHTTHHTTPYTHTTCTHTYTCGAAARPLQSNCNEGMRGGCGKRGEGEEGRLPLSSKSLPPPLPPSQTNISLPDSSQTQLCHLLCFSATRFGG